MAPEILIENTINKLNINRYKCDVFSLGLVMLTLLDE